MSTRLTILTIGLILSLVAVETSTPSLGLASDTHTSTHVRRIAAGIELHQVVADRGLVRAFVLRVDPARHPVDVAVAEHGLETVSDLAKQHRALAAINGDLDLAGQLIHPFIEDGTIVQSGSRVGHV